MLPLSLWHFQTEKSKENHGHAYAPQGAMGLKLWGSLASKLAAYPIALDPHLLVTKPARDENR